MKRFLVIWFGQIVSLLGSAMTWFAFTIWAWQKTGEPSTLAFLTFLVSLPATFLTPFAGALIDRWNRKLVMMLSDLAVALGTLTAFVLYLNHALEIWHIYAIGVVAGCFGAFQYPAYLSAMTVILPKEHYARAEGMMGLASAVSMILGPALGAILLNTYGIAFIMGVDLLTFLVAFATLIVTRIPQPETSEAGKQSRGSLWQETLFGFKYIYRHPGLFSLAKMFMAANFFFAIGAALTAPMILSKSNDPSLLAFAQSAGALGGIAGGALLGIWGGPKRRVYGVLFSGVGMCLLGIVWLGAGSALLFWAIGNFFFSFFDPFVEGLDVAIWQSKVEADLQGRVLSARYMGERIPFLMGFIAAVWFAQNVEKLPATQFEIGAAMSLMIVFAGIGGAVVFLLGYASRGVREIDSAN